MPTYDLGASRTAFVAALMKAKQQAVEKDGGGTVTIYPEEEEDMWHVFNLVAENDRVRASTVR